MQKQNSIKNNKMFLPKFVLSWKWNSILKVLCQSFTMASSSSLAHENYFLLVLMLPDKIPIRFVWDFSVNIKMNILLDLNAVKQTWI